MRKNSTALIVAATTAALATVFGYGATQVNAQTPPNSPVFDWSVVNNSGNAAFTPAPFLTDSSAASVKAFLMKEYNKDPSAVLAVKVTTPISNATAATVFGNSANPVPYSVKCVFADLEIGTSAQDVQATAALVAQIRAVGSNSRTAFIGEFGIAAGYDGTNSSNSVNTNVGQKTPGSNFNFAASDYTNAHVNMSNEAAYPGSPSFASLPSQFPSNNAPPDIRSALFILPVERVGFATIGATGNTNNFYNAEIDSQPKVSAGGYQNIPWISRFNNFGNSSLNTNPGYMGYKYVFHQTGQMLSSNDFSAQVLQYELRGATSFNLFNYTGQANDPIAGNSTNSSVIGYSVKQEQTAGLAGWNYSSTDSVLGGILASNKYSFANLVNKVPGATAGKSLSSISTGMMLSGVYNKTNMTLMLSNMSEAQNTVDFWQKIGGASINLTGANKLNAKSQTTMIAPGSNEILDFTMESGKWMLTNQGTGGSNGIYGTSIFATTATTGPLSRDAYGVPEPASIGLLGLAGLGLLGRRRRSI